MRGRLNALLQKIDAIDQADAVCETCRTATAQQVAEVNVVAGRPIPEVEPLPECPSPKTCAIGRAGGILQIIVEHWRPPEGPDGDGSPTAKVSAEVERMTAAARDEQPTKALGA